MTTTAVPELRRSHPRPAGVSRFRALNDALWRMWLRSGFRGFTRAWSWRHRLGRAELIAPTSVGTWFALDPSGYIDRYVVHDGFYESEVLEEILRALGPNAVFWDIGTNFGLHAVSTKALRPDATVCAFEPSAALAERVKRNAGLNRVNLTIARLALSDRDGRAVLHLAGAGNPGMSTLSPWSEFSYAGTEEVAIRRGDSVVADGMYSPPQVIKLDVEGHESSVLRGMPATLARPDCRVIIFEDGKSSDTETKTLLRRAGFAIDPLERNEKTDHPLANFVGRKA